METFASRIAMVAALGLGFLLAWSSNPADADSRERGWRGGAASPPAQGQEVVAGSYSCRGTVYTDEQLPDISAGSYLYATSGITSGYYGNSQRATDVPADLEAMAEICDRHIGGVVTQMPQICTLGPVATDGGEFGNGASVGSSFEFSCQGTRDAVIGVIGTLGRIALTERLD
jgi:hypothetical protein